MSDFLINTLHKALKTAPDIIGKDKYLNSAVLIPLIKMGNEYEVLFQKRSSGIRQGGEVSFPGGQFNPAVDKSFEETALRETCEELGIEKSAITLIGKLGTVVAPMGLTIDTFIAFLNISSLKEINIDTREVEKVFTFPLKYFLENEPEIFYSRLEIHSTDIDENGNKIELLPVNKLGLPSFYAKPWRSGKHRVIVYPVKPDIIWGLTAEIIYSLSVMLKNQND